MTPPSSVCRASVGGAGSRRWCARLPERIRRSEELSEHVGRILAGYKRPREVFLVDAIRRTASGKTDRRWAAGTARDLSAGDAT